LLLFLSAQGMSLAVISAVRSSEIDSALLRYFVSGMLEIVQPPLSLPFVRGFGSLLMERPFVDTLISQHFEASKRYQIVQLIHQFEAAFTVKGAAPSEADAALLTMLKSTYVKG
jgi:hypothetical protein